VHSRRVLVACEISGRVRDAFSARGWIAVSCDIEPSDNPSGLHIQSDIRQINLTGWDMLIAFPPCTYLAASGNRWHAGTERRIKSLELVRLLMRADIPKIAIENPVGVISTHVRKPDQIIQPWQYGHGETKATCLWLKNLPLLKPTDVVDGRLQRSHMMSPSPDRAKKRSMTYEGVALAMAEQWGSLWLTVSQRLTGHGAN
jgi:hypothetical protein